MTSSACSAKRQKSQDGMRKTYSSPIQQESSQMMKTLKKKPQSNRQGWTTSSDKLLNQVHVISISMDPKTGKRVGLTDLPKPCLMQQ